MNKEGKNSVPKEEKSPEVIELEERLKKAQAERRALEEAREERDLARMLRDQVEAEERGIKDETAIAKAEAEHGDIGTEIAVVKTRISAIILKKSNPILFKRFQDSGKTSTVELDKLVRPTVVYPDKSAFDAIIDALPATLLRCADAVSVLAGVRREDIEGKS